MTRRYRYRLVYIWHDTVAPCGQWRRTIGEVHRDFAAQYSAVASGRWQVERCADGRILPERRDIPDDVFRAAAARLYAHLRDRAVI